jgi:hypothetical protein
MRGPSGDNLEFVTLMLHLRPIYGLGGEPDFEIAVTKNLGRMPRRPGQREGDGPNIVTSTHRGIPVEPSAAWQASAHPETDSPTEEKRFEPSVPLTEAVDFLPGREGRERSKAWI